MIFHLGRALARLVGRTNFVDRVGQVFGRLTVVARASTRGASVRWNCACSCGTEKVVAGTALRAGATKSCGCLRKETAAAQGKKARRHGHRTNKGTPEYGTWCAMRERCNNPRYKQFASYGGRGITVCDRWLKFENFLADMGKKPSKQHTIDRFPNNNGNYEPGNCRWATMTQQNRNRRSTHFIEFRGERRCMKEWAELFGVLYSTFKWRIANGRPMEQALGLG